MYITSVHQPSPVKVTIQVHEDLVPLIQAQCPKSLSTTTFCALLLEQGLTGGCTLTERAPASAGEGGGSVVSTSSITNKIISSNKKKDAHASKHLPESVQVPDAIVDCDQLLREYFSLVCQEGNALRDASGTASATSWLLGHPADRRKALEAAISERLGGRL